MSVSEALNPRLLVARVSKGRLLAPTPARPVAQVPLCNGQLARVKRRPMHPTYTTPEPGV